MSKAALAVCRPPAAGRRRGGADRPGRGQGRLGARHSRQGGNRRGLSDARIAATADRLTGVSTPVADKAELHEMTMQGGVMKMRALAGDRSAGRPGRSR